MDGRPLETLPLSVTAAAPPPPAPAPHHGAAPVTLALTQVPVGQRVRLLKLEAPVGLLQRLSGMGFLQGVELQIIKRHSGKQGPMVVKLGDCRLALGWDLARQIHVEITSPHA